MVTKYDIPVIVGVGIDLIGDAEFQQRIHKSPNLLNLLLRLSHDWDPGASYVNLDREVKDTQTNIQRAKSNLVSIEALFKALPHDLRSQMKKFRFSRDEFGKPYIVYLGQSKEMLGQLKFHISISHDSGVTIGVVIIESL